MIGLPNFLHEEAVGLAAKAGKAVLCTKPLGRTAEEARRMLAMVEDAGVFAGYLEDLCYTPKTLKAIASVRGGAVGDVTWVRSRETHPGPHSAWFWDGRLTGGGAIIDLGCHCIEIIRNFVGKGNRPVDVLCHTDTLVHPIADEDNAIALIRFESGAVGQFEVSWTFRGGMDLRDEVAGTNGTIWLNHFLRTGFEMFTAGGEGGYVAEKAETSAGWLFPVGDEVSELGYVDMFSDMFGAIETGGTPQETFYDGYVVNAIMDACYRSAKRGAWEPIDLEWRGGDDAADRREPRAVRRPGRHQARDPARRPPQADPQGPGDGRLQRPGRRREPDPTPAEPPSFDRGASQVVAPLDKLDDRPDEGEDRGQRQVGGGATDLHADAARLDDTVVAGVDVGELFGGQGERDGSGIRRPRGGRAGSRAARERDGRLTPPHRGRTAGRPRRRLACRCSSRRRGS